MDTICALSTAAGSAGIAVVRISGPESFELIRKVFVPKYERGESLTARYAVLGMILDPGTGNEMDQALVTCFPAPNSYTGEDVAEVSLHGSPVLVSLLLECLCAGGARLAEPGEFTLRAFLSGRMDLSQAEAVRDMIEARTLYQAQVAFRQRSGEIARQMEPLKKLLIDIIVQLESALEFVEENLPLEARELTALKLDGIQKKLVQWIQSFRRGRLVREGFSLAIVGRPNVGKSSLFNSLLAEDRSIVTEIPGTTRDLVSETTNLEGIPVRLLDTAGVRGSGDRVEQLGMDRSFSAMADADALLLVLDGSQPLLPEDDSLREHLQDLSCVVVLNKSDLSPAWSESQKYDYAGNWPLVEVSARTGTGIEDLRKVILSRLFGNEGPERDGMLVTNLRHCQCLERSEEALTRAATALQQNLSEEFVLVDLHAALRKLGEITGETSIEDLLGEIFSRFCVGK
jgi:tRNA modification GTPase